MMVLELKFIFVNNVAPDISCMVTRSFSKINLRSIRLLKRLATTETTHNKIIHLFNHKPT